jgi:hypothetical protein
MLSASAAKMATTNAHKILSRRTHLPLKLHFAQNFTLPRCAGFDALGFICRHSGCVKD